MYGSALSHRAVAVNSEYAVKAEGAASAPMLVEIGSRMSVLVDRIRGAGAVLERINSDLAGVVPTGVRAGGEAPSPAGAFPRLLEMLTDAHSLMDVLENEAQRLSSITGG